MENYLKRALDIYQGQRQVGMDKDWHRRFGLKMQGVKKVVDNIDQHENRRTLPKTNESDKSQPCPSVVTGYRYLF